MFTQVVSCGCVATYTMLPAYGACPSTATEIAGLGGTASEKKPVASA